MNQKQYIGIIRKYSLNKTKEKLNILRLKVLKFIKLQTYC